MAETAPTFELSMIFLTLVGIGQLGVARSLAFSTVSGLFFGSLFFLGAALPSPDSPTVLEPIPQSLPAPVPEPVPAGGGVLEV